ncbi:histidine phosphatase family protein [Shewanella xiamenensis]|uniref:histidine phosphatase family protein n=1 Tax=Shewanella xiamenensis TaxID=332186 RepID=UPI00214FB02C|nr:histidine phosphatase family protein [Shewanella xiamenensis]MCR4536595.1 histidine phosphatase family protein [Shewanella xiamenensis]WHF56531.1 histidine phosphatase family protein [Shewanella xiamenensis]
MKQVRLLLLRHGECEGGAILRGRVDVPLSEKGWQQMSAAVAAQATVCHGIYSSTSRRGAEFAKLLATKHASASVSSSFVSSSLATSSFASASSNCISSNNFAAPTSSPLEVNLLEDLQEMDFGDWDGRLLDELYQQDGDRMAAYWQDPWAVSPPNGETMADFEARVDRAIAAILDHEFARLSFDDKQAHTASDTVANIWVLTHGGVIRHLMARALGAVKVVGFYSQLTLPVAALVTINVLEDNQGIRYWRLDWPSGHGE